MTIRVFESGDEAAQVSIYNEATADLPKFKLAALDEVHRRCQAPDFDPGMRFFATEKGQPVGYASFHANGRVSYPWCRKGFEHLAEPLFAAVLQAMRDRRIRMAFAAYRGDWTAQRDFFLRQDFKQTREMVNYWLDPADTPTPALRRSYPIAPAQVADVPAIFDLARPLIRVKTPAELEQHLFRNPHFPPQAVFVARDRTGSPILGAAVLVSAPGFADVRQVDAGMPCFRLGAFGTEGMQTKRINGLFSFVAKEGKELNQLALDLVGHAASRLPHQDVPAFAAQVASDVPHLLRVYQNYFRRQGSFPVFDRSL